MTISPKALIAVASMAGGCIGVPLCLWRAQSSSMDLSQSLKPLSGTSLTARTTDTPKEKKSVVKGRCDITSFEAGVGDFLTKQHKREGD
ncbi:hypothetical protein OVS_01530 [Mycoplasma ovis str. Michigan]|uniref:Uncharacterized protein n=1 Tax=Mycoplasma ovis str. Michigan TaxID=1415773 RepID=A0ABN4BLE7_9MOLU|nr:hypothetical protein [Mycoplasma ovis]AHC40211.1 hypothetical protein OVS_01530 [Mycoplasma ovis str. Michigan]